MSYTPTYMNQSTYRGLGEEEEVLLTHGDSIQKLAKNFKAIGHSKNIIAGNYY